MSLAKSVALNAWSQFRLNVVFPPSGTVELGDILQPDHGIYRHESTLTGIGVQESRLNKLDVRHEAIGSQTIASKDGASIDFRGTVQASLGLTTDPRASLTLSLNSEDSFILITGSGWRRYYADLSPLQSEIAGLALRRKWRRDWILVTEVWETSTSTFLAGSAGGIRYEMTLAAELQGADLGSILMDHRTAISRHTGASLTYVNGPSSAPLFRGHRWDGALRSTGWRAGSSRPAQGSPAPEVDLDIPTPIAIDEPIALESIGRPEA